MQPLVIDSAGMPRFVENKLVRFIVDEASAGRKCDLNRLAMRRHTFSQADWEQFYQLIGYSLKGYHELSMVSDESALAASAEAEKLEAGLGKRGCRAAGCAYHCGVPTAAPGQPTPEPPDDEETDDEPNADDNEKEAD